jgi:hypothetical protein
VRVRGPVEERVVRVTVEFGVSGHGDARLVHESNMCSIRGRRQNPPTYVTLALEGTVVDL